LHWIVHGTWIGWSLSWTGCRKSPSPESYKETISQVTKLVFGESRKHIIPRGVAFTAEEVKLRQPDTDDFMDTKTMDPKMFASAPSGPPPKLATGDGLPKPASAAALTVTAPTVELKSKAAPSAPSGPSSSANRPQLPARPEEHVGGLVKAYWMEDHLPSTSIPW